MAIVSEIREIKGIIEVSLDGVRWLKLRKKHFALHPLELDEAVDPEEYIDSIAAAQAADCYEAALTMLDQAAQTRNDLAKKLMRKGYVAPAAEAAAARLCEIGLIDDRRFAERIAQGQLKKPVGAYAVRRKLMARQLSEEDVEAAMEGFDDAQQAGACKAAAEKLWRKYSALPSREGRAKLSQALARRGFSWDAIRSAVDALASDEDFFE
ncbi:MAG: RecX family transcriptional regulator [Clostridia bacterium]|nr:RecX family transcriptional regulator [Clostridia bacterium]